MGLKPYIVTVSKKVIVVAKSKEEAKHIAEDNYEEDSDDFTFSPMLITKANMKSVPVDFLDGLPWKPDEDEEKTFRDYVEDDSK